MQEEWKSVKGFEGSYQISNIGNVRSINRVIEQINNGTLTKINRKGKILKQGISRDGYPVIKLRGQIKNKYTSVHRLVAQEFVSNPNNYPIVNHIDGNKENPTYTNLEWVTNSENAKHSYKIGTSISVNGRLVLDKQTGIYYNSIAEAARLLGYNAGTLQDYLKENRKNKTNLELV